MEIINNLQFSELDGTTNGVHVYGDILHPLFLAAQLGGILNISCVHSSIRDYTIVDKLELPMQIGTIFYTVLTESGAMRLIFRSNKPNAKALMTWMLERIRGMRTAFYENALAIMQVKYDHAIVQRDHALQLLLHQSATLAVPAVLVEPNELMLYLEYKTRQMMRGGDVVQLVMKSDAMNRDFNFVCRFRILSIPNFEGWSENHMSMKIDVDSIEGIQKVPNDDGKTWYTLDMIALKKYLRSINLLKREWWEIRV